MNHASLGMTFLVINAADVDIISISQNDHCLNDHNYDDEYDRAAMSQTPGTMMTVIKMMMTCQPAWVILYN